MNSKAILSVVAVLTLVTALIHLFLGGAQLARVGGGGPGGRPPANPQSESGGGQPSNEGQPPAGGQRPGGGGGPGGGGFVIFRYLPYLFILNGIGFLALLALLLFRVPYFGDHPALTHWLMIGFAALTFVLYFAMNINNLGAFTRNLAAIAAKSAELLLIVFTFLHLRSLQASASPTEA